MRTRKLRTRILISFFSIIMVFAISVAVFGFYDIENDIIKRVQEISGMMIKAAAPVFGYDSSFIGALYGGNLLNRNHKIVDKVKETVS